jgi:pimeloyl-ACP methyl ester carboxylesterase
MAGGTAVVTAAGTALGGALGATTVAAYTKEDRSFDLEKLKEGDGPPVVIASGFLTEGDRGWGPWRRLVEGAYPDSPVYRVTWGAKELRAFASMVGLIGGKQLSSVAIKKLALGAMKTAGKKLGPLGIALTAKDVATNPWTVARTRADMTGAVMADLLARTDGQPFVLVGHSLGARVMAEAALALGTKRGAPVLLDVHLLGAAIDSGKDWRYASEAVQGTIYNYFSRNDKVLSVLYQLAELGSKPIGLGGIPTRAANVKNRDVSRVVAGHGDYFNTVTLSTR